MGRIEIHQKDGNAEELYDSAEKLGMTVERIQRPVDAMIGFQGLTVAVEVKQPNRPLERSQVQFFERFTGAATIWRTTDDVIATRNELAAKAKLIAAAQEL